MKIEEAIKVFDWVSQEAEKSFGKLSVRQLNFKPSPEKWSIAQCLDHLMVSNSSFYPQFKQIISGKHRNSFYQNIEFLSRFFADYLIKETGPVVKKPQKNPSVWTPAQSNLPATIVSDFLVHQQELSNLIHQLKKTDLEKTVIGSPALAIITFNLHDALTILAGHEQRHLQQAKNVLNNHSFPQ